MDVPAEICRVSGFHSESAVFEPRPISQLETHVFTDFFSFLKTVPEFVFIRKLDPRNEGFTEMNNNNNSNNNSLDNSQSCCHLKPYASFEVPTG